MALPLPDSGCDGLAASLVTDDREFLSLAPAWDELWLASAASPFLAFDWLQLWWTHFGPSYAGPGQLRMLLLHSGTRLVAALPFYLHRSKRICFIGTGEQIHETVYPEYLDCLIHPEHIPQVRSTLHHVLVKTRTLRWRELYLGLMADRSHLHSVLNSSRKARLCRSFGYFYQHPCFEACIESGLEGYFARLSSNARQQYRKLLRQVQAVHAEIRIAQDAETALTQFEELVRLHTDRWKSEGLPGAFSSSTFTRFHRALLRRWLPSGRAVIASLSAGQNPIAVLYGFVAAGRFYFYQSGVAGDGQGAIRSPGIAAHLLLMQALAQRGIETYDFLAGEAEYKRRLATFQHALVEQLLVSPGFPTLLPIALRALKTAGSKAAGFARNARASWGAKGNALDCRTDAHQG